MVQNSVLELFDLPSFLSHRLLQLLALHLVLHHVHLQVVFGFVGYLLGRQLL